MRTPVRLAAFGGAVLLAFGAALGVGAAVGDPTPEGVDHGGGSDSDHGAGAGSGPQATFSTTTASGEDQRLFLDARHENVVRSPTTLTTTTRHSSEENR